MTTMPQHTWLPEPLPEADPADQASSEQTTAPPVRRDVWSGTRDTDRPEAWS